MNLSIKWKLLSSKNILLPAGLANEVKPKKITIHWRNHFFQLSWFINNSTPCFLWRRTLYILLIAINNLPHSTAAASSHGICWKSDGVSFISRENAPVVNLTSQKTLHYLACPLQTLQEVLNLVDNSLETSTRTMRSTISTVFKAIPRVLNFFGGMLLNVPCIFKWQTISCNQEALINETLLKAN